MSTKICPNCQKVVINKKTFIVHHIVLPHLLKKNGGNHKWSEEGKRKLSEWAKKYAYHPPPIQKIKKQCLQCKKEFDVFKSKFKRKCCSKKCYLEWMKSTNYMKGKCGGYRIGAGRGKHGWYKGYHCDSSWELAWVIYQLDHNISFKRNTEKFPYTFEGKSYSYIPDFIMSNGEYVEIKSWPNEKTKSKLSQFTNKLKILWKSDMEDIIDYVKQTYGKDFIRLYEGNPHNDRNNKCKICGKPAKNSYCSKNCGGKRQRMVSARRIELLTKD